MSILSSSSPSFALCRTLAYTTAGFRELKRCFSVARKAYNWANARVKEGGPKNIIKLRTEWRALPPPDWASTAAKKVASSIQEGAIRQLVAAYSSNDAKRKKNPEHRYDVQFRSLKGSDAPLLNPCSTHELESSCSFVDVCVSS
jgi:hypothetical protein